MNTALITGITGQDGHYLSRLLLSKGYRVVGLIRRHSGAMPALADGVETVYADLTDATSLTRAIEQSTPDEVYNLGAQSHVRVSFDIPEYTGDVAGLGVTRLLEAIRWSGLSPRIYQASSSEMFGSSPPPQNENTPMMPRSPYAAAKLYAYHMARNYRDAYGMHISNGILFNHESPLRPDSFVTRKITKAAARIKLGLQDSLVLGNLDARRDWGFAGDYVEAMWLMLQQDKPDDFVIATGEDHSVREFLDEAFGLCGLDWKQYVRQDQALYRPTEVESLRGDASKSRTVLGWQPKLSFKQLVAQMVRGDIRECDPDGAGALSCGEAKWLADAGRGTPANAQPGTHARTDLRKLAGKLCKSPWNLTARANEERFTIEGGVPFRILYAHPGWDTVMVECDRACGWIAAMQEIEVIE